MTGKEYCTLALKTEKTPLFVRVTGDEVKDRALSRIMHALLGMMSEIGEIADAMKKLVIYSKDLDILNLIEEHGDESWYMSLLIDACGSTWEQSWAKNIAKLKARYGDKFTEEKALNRDLEAERAALAEITAEVEGYIFTRRECNMLEAALKSLDVSTGYPYEENVALREKIRKMKLEQL
jgi:NTP pyrophosphatase (non-canonical NTP hydrolase)